MKTGLHIDPVYLRHDTGPGHPERPARLETLERRFESAGIKRRTTAIPSRQATEAELARCHDAGYVALARREIAAGRSLLSTGDTNVCADTWEPAVTAAGSLLEAVDAVVEGRVANAFCAVRPPGHHATADRGMGFCVFNNVAVAARHAQAAHGVGRVVVIDWDVHHGNGTQDIFYADGSVFYFSTHQWPWYPGTGAADETGEGRGSGTTLNCPLPAGSGMDRIGQAFRERFLPAMEKFRPELVLVSAGFDSRAGDPLGHFTLTDDDFRELTRIVMDVAAAHAGGRLVSVLEGGYNVEGLASAALAHVATLLGDEAARDGE